MFHPTKSILSLLTLALVFSLLLPSCGRRTSAETNETRSPGYGVFIGAERERLFEIMENRGDLRLAVIEGQEFSAGDIREFKKNGRRIYSYLNIGSVETYRDYFDRFRADLLGEYENWPDEFWIDVSDPDWQRFIADEIAGGLIGKGIDGFFIDNCDVYYHYERREIFDGLTAILARLREYGAPLIINGGDVFVSKLLADGRTELIDGVNQECVFTRIKNYEKDILGKQNRSETAYFTEYLDSVSSASLRVYLLEYTTDPALMKKIADHCDRRGFGFYISDSKELDGNTRTGHKGP
ncbi:MAG: endo alpha-1,4 polygalactosaminidase [Clostridia bacterium]|nr:endo alpha-1,4 polygalactosaminidase [Clostridia bacterium]